MKAAVFLCDVTGVMARPWAEAGYLCVCVDVQHSIRRDRVEQFASGGSIVYRWDDVRSVTPEDFPAPIRFACAFPPCTDLTVAGNQDWPKKGLRRLIDSLELVESCRTFLAYTGAPWFIENPVGRLSTCWRKPDHTFDPCDYAGYPGGEGDTYTKRTCLWTGGGFIMPAPRRLEPVDGSRMHRMAPGPDRANLRSATPKGFARAVFEANQNGPALRLAV